MNKNELILKISKKLDINKAFCNNFINNLISIINQELNMGEVVNIFGFGKFYVKEKYPRIYFSPIKNAYLKSKYKCEVCFMPSKKLKIDII